MINLKSRRSQSQVVSTILLILISISAIVVIISFVMPLINDQLSESDCFEVLDEVTIVNSPVYTCYTSGKMNVRIAINENKDLDGFVIVLGDDITSESYEIREGVTSVSGVEMYDGNAVIEVPGKKGERTYGITRASSPNFVDVYPILKSGKICPSPQTLNNVNLC